MCGAGALYCVPVCVVQVCDAVMSVGSWVKVVEVCREWVTTGGATDGDRDLEPEEQG